MNEPEKESQSQRLTRYVSLRDGEIPNKVTCDECGHEFPIVRVMQRPWRKNVWTVYFVCPHCKKEYDLYRMNSKLDRLSEQMEYRRGLIARLRRRGEDASKALDDHELLREEYKAEFDRLNPQGEVLVNAGRKAKDM